MADDADLEMIDDTLAECVLWPKSAIEGAEAERLRLAGLIEQAREKLEAIPQESVDWLRDQLWHDSRGREVAGGLLEALKILAEADHR